MELDHPVLGEKHLLEVIISFLEVEDLLIVTHVCFMWREVVFSDPYREISIIRFALRSNSQQLGVRVTQAYKKRYGPLREETVAARPQLHRSPLVTFSCRLRR